MSSRAGALPQPVRSASACAASRRSETNGVLAGVGGVYLAKVSLPVTVVAEVSAVVLASLIVIVHR
ncbi:hypothetical protein ACGGAQ_03300 [Micromonospora sp. NPDC047557]|uniref:hypothetical protein n=1 Tax=Micromonospora sp. NPDC047557 TaxID=3364250 RepID=UPI003714D4E9